ncbi:hypothetical protein Bca52824_057573 [Brassica carinata]|uniref:Uncharacterized protein n=1 Tax=Brassica carinata TaxID=52824 RepID=A0A8X7QRC2_BRACI|nr:hypothetical protein Bca52824_057573 [Brassica carinata]
MVFLFVFGSDASSRQIKTDMQLIGGYYCIGSKRMGLTGRQAVDELIGGVGASVGGSERALEHECVLDAMAYAIGTGFGALSMASVLSILDGWLETKPSLFAYMGHVGMVG